MMKCLVCNHENSTIVCSQCGFDASQDYAHYPTLSPVGKVPSITSLRKQWQRLQQKPSLEAKGAQFVDYQKMVSLEAIKESNKRTSFESRLIQEIQIYRDQISNLKREQKTLTDSLIPENKQLKARILDLHKENQALQAKCNRAEIDFAEESELAKELQSQIDKLNAELLSCQRKYEKLEQKYIQTNRYYENSLAHNNGLLRSKAELEQMQKELIARNDSLVRRVSELEQALEEIQSKGFFSRLFNR